MSVLENVAVLAASSTPTTEFAARIRTEAIPVNPNFSYYFLDLTPSEDDLKELVVEPVTGLPPRILELLPPVQMLFVPFLELQTAKHSGSRTNGRRGTEVVTNQRPAKPLTHTRVTAEAGEALLFSMDERDTGECHYRFFQGIATMVAERWPDELEKNYVGLVRQELRANVHGEVDEASWEKKIALVERSAAHGTTKALREYARQSFIDTLTLYLHGICCDLDVDTGPRQLASRHLRKRLDMLAAAFPPPKGYAVFPEDLKN
jgi:hypothetical protein